MINKDYCYCTAKSNSLELCPLRENCKRFSLEALEHEEPLSWTDGFYLESDNSCEFQDVKEMDFMNKNN